MTDAKIKSIVLEHLMLEFEEPKKYMQKLWWCITDYEDTFALLRIGILSEGQHKGDVGDFIVPTKFDDRKEIHESRDLWDKFNDFQYFDPIILI